MTTCAELLTENYLEWQKQQGQVRKLKDFAEFLEIHEVTLNLLINGRKQATTKMLVHLANKTGDVRFYEVADLLKPDPLLNYVQQEWGELTLEQQNEIREKVERFLTENKGVSSKNETHSAA
jgi:hypothetical protein